MKNNVPVQKKVKAWAVIPLSDVGMATNYIFNYTTGTFSHGIFPCKEDAEAYSNLIHHLPSQVSLCTITYKLPDPKKSKKKTV